jgi:hypothetical protein
MALSTHFLNAHQAQHVYLYADINPWGGISNLNSVDFVAKARVEDITINEGANYDTATILMSSADFGDDFPYYQPLKVVVIDNINTGGVGINNSGNGAGVIVLFRGFITKQDATLTSNSEEVRLNLSDYKWLLSKRTMIRGQIYKTDANTDSPVPLGSGLSSGNQRYTFEKFRTELAESTGFLQQSECVFNRGSLPDCYIDNNTGSPNAVFYKNDIDEDESNGLSATHFAGREFKAYYWTWASILSYIERYWIEPYNSTFANVRISEGDLFKIKTIPSLERRPMDFSIEGSNPLTAIDNVVKNLPGRWIWYLDYASNNVKIRIIELKPFGTQSISLRVCDSGSKLAEGDQNVTSASVSRDASKSAKNLIMRGGKIKVNTTIKLVPLWQRYADGTDGNGNARYKDFSSNSDLNNWRIFIKARMGDKNKGIDVTSSSFTSEEIERYSRIYRVYGVPEEGGLLGNSIQSQGTTTDQLNLTGDIGAEYTGLTTDLREMFYDNVRLKREVTPPVFNRYSEKVEVFMYDPRQGAKLSGGNSGTVTETNVGNDVNRKPRKSDSTPTPTAAENIEMSRDDKWVIPAERGINYSFDDKSGIVKFDIPQMQVRKSASGNPVNDITENFGAYVHDYQLPSTGLIKAESRDIFMTATFTTDVGCIFDTRTDFGVIDRFRGATFSSYETQNNSDIVVHVNAWYPLTETNRDIQSPTSSTETLGGNASDGVPRELGKKIRKCNSFSDYTFYIGHSPQEALRSLKAMADDLKFYDEDVSASLAYLETGYNIGDRITKIQGTKYDDLESYLMSINYSKSGDSDNYTTSYTLRNHTERNNNATGYASPKDEANKQRESNRYVPLYINEKGQELKDSK